jgi:hypothetical protein
MAGAEGGLLDQPLQLTQENDLYKVLLPVHGLITYTAR